MRSGSPTWISAPGATPKPLPHPSCPRGEQRAMPCSAGTVLGVVLPRHDAQATVKP